MRITKFLSSSRYLALSSVFLALGARAGIAQTTTNDTSNSSGAVASAKPLAGQMLELTVCRSAATFPLDVSTKTPTMVEVPFGFDYFIHKANTKYTIEREGNKLYIAAPSNTEVGHELAVRIVVSKPIPFEASLHTRAVDYVRGVKDNVVIYHQTDQRRFGKRANDNPCNLRTAKNPRQRLLIRAFDRQQSESRSVGVPEIEHVIRSGDGVPIELSMFDLESGNLVLDFNADNQRATTARVTEVRVLDRHHEEIASEIWRWDHEGQPIQEPQLVIDGFQDVQASIHIPDAAKHELEPMWVEFRGMRGAMPFVTSMQVGTFRHMTPEEIEQMRKDEERRREIERLRLENERHEAAEREWRERERERAVRAKQMSVSARGLFGTLWVGPGTTALTDEVGVDGAAMGGLSVRVTKGLLPNFAIEAEFAGGRSGMASFSDTAWQGMQGDVARQAAFGRLQGFGVVRFGDLRVISMRLGVGIQGATYDSSFTSGGMTMEGPGKPFEFDFVWSFGGNFETRLWRNWVWGVGATATDGINTDMLGFDIGLHVGYRWPR